MNNNNIPNYIYNVEPSICIEKIHQQTNQRIYERNIPSQPLQPNLTVRPVLTKYSYFPIVDPRKEIQVRMEQLPFYNSETIFNPGNTQSPWAGFATNINKESELRNQIYALQKGSQPVFVPSSKSDLYQYSFQPKMNNNSNQHSLLFAEEKFDDFNPNPESSIIGIGIFNNATRVQVKELTGRKPKC